MLKRYYEYLRRSAQTLPQDIVQPYHKIIDLGIKLVSLWFAIVGAYNLVVIPGCYFDFVSGVTISTACVYTLGEAPAFPAIMSEGQVEYQYLMSWLWAAGYMLIALFMSQVLVVRHLNETLPDHIYLRCFSTEEEKKRRLPNRT